MTNLRIVLFIALFLTVILSVYYFVIDDNMYYIIAQEPTLNDPNLQVETIVEGLSWPTSMAFIDNNNILVLEKEKGTVPTCFKWYFARDISVGSRCKQ